MAARCCTTLDTPRPYAANQTQRVNAPVLRVDEVRGQRCAACAIADPDRGSSARERLTVMAAGGSAREPDGRWRARSTHGSPARQRAHHRPPPPARRSTTACRRAGPRRWSPPPGAARSRCRRRQRSQPRAEGDTRGHGKDEGETPSSPGEPQARAAPETDRTPGRPDSRRAGAPAGALHGPTDDGRPVAGVTCRTAGADPGRVAPRRMRLRTAHGGELSRRRVRRRHRDQSGPPRRPNLLIELQHSLLHAPHDLSSVPSTRRLRSLEQSFESNACAMSTACRRQKRQDATYFRTPV